MEAPDSLGLIRLANLAGRSGSAHVRLQRDSVWVTFSAVRFDATGLRAGLPGQAVAHVTDVWTEAMPDTDIAWSSITRLQVPRPHGPSLAPMIGAAVGGLISLPFVLGWPEGSGTKPGALVLGVALGALVGKGLSVINPFRGPDWVDFP
jgi:hypothetical protein